MIIYDSAKSSLDVEQFILEKIGEFKSIEDLKRSPYINKSDNIYKITIATLNAWAHKERPLEAERLITKGRLGGGTFRWIPASEGEAS
jgi:hypothetical protein